MRVSDLLLVIVVIAAGYCALRVFDAAPYSKNFVVYTQTCSKMILNNTFCDGKWESTKPVTYAVDKENKTIKIIDDTATTTKILTNCSIQDRKNWSCDASDGSGLIQIQDGNQTSPPFLSSTHQITRLEWLQEKFLHQIGKKSKTHE